MWVGTFHGLAHRLLRAHHLDANLPQDFQILDSEDQLRLLKRLIKAMNLDEKQWPPRQAMWYINSQKDEGLRPHHIQSYGNPVEQTAEGLSGLPEACDRAGLVDFAELLLRAHELWLNKPHILQHYQSVSPISLSMNSVTPTTSSTPDPPAGGRYRQSDDRWR